MPEVNDNLACEILEHLRDVAAIAGNGITEGAIKGHKLRLIKIIKWKYPHFSLRYAKFLADFIFTWLHWDIEPTNPD